jgi:tetratricopeptide (TPR) repeat protein
MACAGCSRAERTAWNCPFVRASVGRPEGDDRGDLTFMSMIAALILPFALLQTEAAPSGAIATRSEQCLALITTDPARAYEEGMAWAAEAHSVHAYHCAAMALSAQNRHVEAARRLQSLADTMAPENAALRAELWWKSGNEWLLAREPGQARSVFTKAIQTLQSDPAQLPTVLIDRANAYAMEREWRLAEEDLSRAIDIRPDNALALRLRATARMHQRTFELAQADALAAVRLEPGNEANTLVLGDVRESIRTGAPVER